MSDTSAPRVPVRITVCDTDETLRPASLLFDRYRQHYGRPDADGRALPWLRDMVRSGLLTVWTASDPDGAPDGAPVGLATAHPVPASLALGRSWQLRDLFVLPAARRRGTAATLVDAVRDAARAAGATRLSLVTETDNRPALDLYQRLGFTPVEGYVTLGLDLGRASEPPAPC